MRSVRCKLNFKEEMPWHLRPAGYVSGLCRRFPRTDFVLRKATDPDIEIDPKNLLALTVAGFEDGEEIMLEVTGVCEVLASEFFKVVWENLSNYSADQVASKARLARLVDETFARIDDPDLRTVSDSATAFTPVPKARHEEARSVATINDRLHNLTLPMVPLIAQFFETRLELSFEVPSEGIFAFEMGPTNDYTLDKDILDLQVEVGTRITIRTWGISRFKANEAVNSILQSLWQCDDWLRRRARGFETENTILDLLEFATHVGRSQSAEYGYVQNPFISNLLSNQHVLIRNGNFSKEDALAQLAAPHARIHGLEMAAIVSRVADAERKLPVILREGFAIAHGAMERNPRLAITFGVFRDGVCWNAKGEKVLLVAMVLCAEDTYGTWRDYLKKFAMVFRSKPDLQDRLIGAETSDAFLRELRAAEVALIE